MSASEMHLQFQTWEEMSERVFNDLEEEIHRAYEFA